MWYEVPQAKPKQEYRPAPIFPWEGREGSRPSRVFSGDPVLLSPPIETETTDSTTKEDAAVSEPPQSSTTQHPSTTAAHEDAPWQSFSHGTRNAWDGLSGIDNYVRALTAGRKHRGGLQILSHSGAVDDFDADDSGSSDPNAQSSDRRASLRLTDFPSATERPSLPVTPAPIRRPTFWGEEKDALGGLPGAEGVPDQADWVSS